MDAIFELIFGNIVVFIAIIWAVLNFFSRLQGNEQQTPTQEKPVYKQPEVQPQKVPEKKIDPREAFFKPNQSENTFSEDMIEQAEKIEQAKNEHDALPDDESISKPNQPKKLNKQLSVNRQFTKKRIVESLIMSEVLGPPRAYKPFNHRDRRN
ncbi:MAG: hypothetical protein H0Z32_06250 [Bacillaceae bacterium]|nr:hypothetical protein [Bacillaceae bacterium]